MKTIKVYIAQDKSLTLKENAALCGSGGGTQTTIQKTDPPAYLQPFLTEAAQQAQSLYRSGAHTVAPTAQQTEQALQLAEQRALAGSPLTAAAQQQVQQTLTGQAGNEFVRAAQEAALRPVTEQFQTQVLPGLASQAAGAGRTGSGLVAGLEDRALGQYLRSAGDISSKIGLAATETERARQFGAAQLAPQLAAQDFADIQRLANVGATREAIQQRQLSVPAARLNQYIAQITGTVSPGAGVTTSIGPSAAGGISPVGRGVAGGLAGAGTGAAIGSKIGASGGPIGALGGAAIGGGIGLLGGLFG